ncbi:hypothetical protein [Streptomyces sp. NBC_01465]|uniref:hypothetical protein n=1 Tax=Streptomyces sp. NBC_01465 TaxID=2903878 RepID=UPI002E3472F2|nr:hypothetical protein [Streptomyces sp. NBC_01465]
MAGQHGPLQFAAVDRLQERGRCRSRIGRLTDNHPRQPDEVPTGARAQVQDRSGRFSGNLLEGARGNILRDVHPTELDHRASCGRRDLQPVELRVFGHAGRSQRHPIAATLLVEPGDAHNFPCGRPSSGLGVPIAEPGDQVEVTTSADGTSVAVGRLWGAVSGVRNWYQAADSPAQSTPVIWVAMICPWVDSSAPRPS